MGRVYSYFIAEGDSADALRTRVLQAMEKPGWRPTGGVAISGGRFYQAMLLDEDAEKHQAEVEEYQEYRRRHPPFTVDPTTDQRGIYDGE